MGELIYSLKTGLNPRKFFKLNTKDAKNYYVTIKEMKNGNIVFNESTDMINDMALKLCNERSELDKDDILFSGTGTIGEMVYINEKPKNWNIKEGIYTLKPNKNLIFPKYLYYILKSTSVVSEYKNKFFGGTVKSLAMSDMKTLSILIPPIEIQEYVVSFLDKFDKITNDLKDGIPAEINLRQKQYEYYREKLFDFTKNN